MTTQSPTENDRAWLFVGLVGPVVPGLVAWLVVTLKWLAPVYGALLALLITVTPLFVLLLQPSMTEPRRKALKAGLDFFWNIWAFITAGVLLTAVGAGAPKLDDMLRFLAPTWITLLSIAVCGTAAARIALAAAEWFRIIRPLAPSSKQPLAMRANEATIHRKTQGWD